MKYEPKRNYLYPVLRPYSDDYSSEELGIEVTTEPVEEHVRISVKFDVGEPSIRNQIADGNARCVAMLYCRDTLHREMLRAGKGRFEITENVQSRYLVNDVEIHPAVVAVNGINHPTKTAHPEYGGAAVQVGKFQPLATAQTWRFSVNADQRAAKGIFNLAPDDTMRPDVFDVEINSAARYITIKADPDTLRQFMNIRRNELLTLPSVYMNALVEALAYIKINRLESGGGGDVHSAGWVNCILSNLQDDRISVGDVDNSGSHSLMYAAQMLLAKPFGDMIRFELDRIDDDPYSSEADSE